MTQTQQMRTTHPPRKKKDTFDEALIALMKQIRKGTLIDLNRLEIKEGETSPPKRYNSGSLILAMENAGQLIEDEELRSQIKGSGIGTSATRAEILSKLVTMKYLKAQQKDTDHHAGISRRNGLRCR